MKKEQYSTIFIILCAINITCILISNIITIKTINIFGLIFTAGDILFPITYILNDVFTEVYGYNKSKFIIWLSFFCNLFMVIIFKITILLPVNESFNMQNQLVNILETTPRILIASFISFLTGSFANSMVMSKMKVRTQGKYLSLRAIVSTLVGEGLDTIIFIPIVFIGRLDIKILLVLTVNTYILKVLLEVFFTPITYKVIALIKQKDNIDTYDNEQNYSIF